MTPASPSKLTPNDQGSASVPKPPTFDDRAAAQLPVRLWLALFAVCLVLGLVETAQVVTGNGDIVESSWGVALLRVIPSWVLLAALSPLAVMASARWPIKGDGMLTSLGAHVVLSFPFSLLHFALIGLWARVRPGSAGLSVGEAVAWLSSRFLVYELLAYGALVGLVHAWRYHAELGHARSQADQLVFELEKARRRAVEGKLHPHFVFNTLNAIAGLAARGDCYAVVRTLDAFSDLLRATLDDHVSEPVPLRDEIELLERYVEIQSVRFGARLAVAWEIDAPTLDRTVPGMLLQPLVENAIKHGVGRNRDGGTVTIRARVVGGELVVEVDDTGPGPRPTSASKAQGRGIGLEATRSRLESLFGRSAGLELVPLDGGGSRVVVHIPETGTGLADLIEVRQSPG